MQGLKHLIYLAKNSFSKIGLKKEKRKRLEEGASARLFGVDKAEGLGSYYCYVIRVAQSYRNNSLALTCNTTATSLTSALLKSFHSAVMASSQCWYPNGSPAEQLLPCTEFAVDGESACCWVGLRSCRACCLLSLSLNKNHSGRICVSRMDSAFLQRTRSCTAAPAPIGIGTQMHAQVFAKPAVRK